MDRTSFGLICLFLIGTSRFLFEYVTFNRKVAQTEEVQVKAFSYDKIGSENESNIQLYLRMTSTKKFIDQAERLLLRSMKMFFLKKYLDMVLVLDNEKSEDHEYGKSFVKSHPEIKTKVCYMDPVADNADHGWGKARMYLDMLHADSCSTKEYVGFVDTDTVFVTAFTDDILFENGKPIVIGKIGMPQFPCWIQTAAYILRVKQVIQCMAYFPITFKVAHIVEMRKYVERLHLKSFIDVFKEAPSKVNVFHECYCHFSIMCNYIWYHHRDEYAWHLQMVPDGKWNGQQGIPAMVDPQYFQNQVESDEKIPIPRASVHGKYLRYKGVYYEAVQPWRERLNYFLREGLCHSFGFKTCPEKCSRFKETAIQDSLFQFEVHNWLWDDRCNATQGRHYEIVHRILKNEPHQFLINLTNKKELCSVIDDLLMEN